MKSTWIAIAGLAALLLIGAALWFLPRELTAPPPAPTPAPPVAVAPQEPLPASAPEPAIKHPIEPAAQAAEGSAPFDLKTALAAVFGSKPVQALFQLEDFPRRFVATVDNLGRVQATPRLWPVNPVGGKFLTQSQGSGERVSPDNGLRYTSYVALLERVDIGQAVGLYKQIYPVLQHEYEELGYPHGYFNDRLVDVIDLLMKTPEPNDPLAVHLPPDNGAAPPSRPWLLYEFDDPTLQSLAAGQKILLRMGPVNTRRVKARLAEVRKLVAGAQAPMSK